MQEEAARLFVGVELDEATRSTVAAWAQELEGRIPGRYHAPELYHITLCFLGCTPRSAVPRIARAMSAAFDAPFELSLSRLGTFKGGSILYAGVNDCPPLSALQGRLAGELRAEGFSLPQEEYVPHLTLARHAGGAAEPLSAPQTLLRVERIALFESARVEGRLRYTPLLRRPEETP